MTQYLTLIITWGDFHMRLRATARRDAVAGVELHLGNLGGLVDLLLHFVSLLSVKVDVLLLCSPPNPAGDNGVIGARP